MTRFFFLPSLRISDAPRLALRAVHLCWFPETPPAWGTPPHPAAPQFDTAFAVALRLAGRDAGVRSYPATGLYADQLALP